MDNNTATTNYEVIHVVNSHLSRSGNFGVRANRILRKLEEEGYSVCCISRGGGKKATNYYNFIIFGFFARFLNFVRLRLLKDFNHRSFERVVFEQLVLRKLRKLNLDGSIVHLWEFSERIISYVQERNAKVILEVPNVTQNYVEEVLKKNPNLGLSFFYKQLKSERRALDTADLVLVPSQFVSKYAKLLSPNCHCKIVPFGFPSVTDTYMQNRGKKKLNLLFVGNVDVRKGVPLILEALRDLEDLDFDMRFVGRNGGLPNSLLKNTSKINFIGFSEPSAHYAWADIFVFPSWCEGSAKVIYEAMAHGLAVVTTNAAGSLITDQMDGMIIEEGCVAGIRKALRTLASNRDLIDQYGRNAQRLASTRSWATYVDDVVASYESIR